MKIIGLCLIASATFASAEQAHTSDPRRLKAWGGWGRQRRYFGRTRWGGNNDKDGGKQESSISWGENWNKPGVDSWNGDNDKEDGNNWSNNDKEHGNGWGDHDKVDGNWSNGDKPGEGGWNWGDNNDKKEGYWNKPGEVGSNWSGADNWNKPNGGDGSKPDGNGWGEDDSWGNGDNKPGEGGWDWNDNDKEDGNNWSGAGNWNKPDGDDGGKPGEGGWGGSNGGKPDNNNGDNDDGKPDGNDNGGGSINPGTFVSLSDLGSPGQFNVRVQHGGIGREFLIYVPQSYNSAQRVPLLFNFHGFGGNMNGYLVGEADMRPVADAENFILVYPQGSTEATSNSPHWNSAPVGGDNKSTADDIGFVNQLIDQLASVYSVDSSRVYAAGYSNGGGMAYYLGCDLSQRIAGIASVSSSGPVQGCNPSHPMPMISLHGTTDNVIPYNGGNGWSGASQTLDFWVNFNGAQTPPVITTDRSSGMTIERSVFAAGRLGVPIEHYRYMNGGHVWFMNNFQGRTTGQLIWDYLSQFSLENLSN